MPIRTIAGRVRWVSLREDATQLNVPGYFLMGTRKGKVLTGSWNPGYLMFQSNSPIAMREYTKAKEYQNSGAQDLKFIVAGQEREILGMEWKKDVNILKIEFPKTMD